MFWQVLHQPKAPTGHSYIGVYILWVSSRIGGVHSCLYSITRFLKTLFLLIWESISFFALLITQIFRIAAYKIMKKWFLFVIHTTVWSWFWFFYKSVHFYERKFQINHAYFVVYIMWASTPSHQKGKVQWMVQLYRFISQNNFFYLTNYLFLCNSYLTSIFYCCLSKYEKLIMFTLLTIIGKWYWFFYNYL